MATRTAPNETLQQTLGVNLFESTAKSLLVGVALTVWLTPMLFVVGTILDGVDTVSVIAIAFAGLTTVIFVVKFVGGLLAAMRNEYHIYDDRLEVVEGMFTQEQQTVPMAELYHADLSQGLLEAHFDAGDINVETRRRESSATLQNVQNAEAWFEHLAPINGESPLQTVSPVALAAAIGRTLWIAVLVLLIPSFFAVVGLVFVANTRPDLLPIALGALGVAIGSLLIASFVYYYLKFRGSEYRIYTDRIEDCVGLGTNRTFVHAADITDVTLSRGLVGRLFGVGTVEVEARYREEPFRMKYISDAESLYRKLGELAG